MTPRAVERALRLLEVLSTHPEGLERREVRWRLADYRALRSPAAFERTFERDKQALRALGINLVAERDPSVESGFVYRLRAKNAVESPLFSATDYIVLSRCARAWEGTEAERLAGTAILKLGAFTRQPFQNHLGEPARFSAIPGLIECIISIAESKGLSFVYGSAEHVRKILCWGLGIRFGHWYVAGWDSFRREQRIFRLNRMKDVKVLATFDGPFPPSDFTMINALARLESQRAPMVATQTLTSHSVDQNLRISPSFGVLESVQSALAQGYTHCLGNSSSGQEDIDYLYQAEVAEAEQALRAKLICWHRETPEISTPKTAKDWKPLVVQRSRDSASEQLIRLLLMVALIYENGGMDLADLAQFFNVSQKKIRHTLEDLPYSLENESFNLTITETGFVTIQGKPHLASEIKLTDAERLVLSLALDLEASSNTEFAGIASLIKWKLWSVTDQQEARAGGAALATRVAVFRADIDKDLAYSLKYKVPLHIRYSSRRGITSRTIEPESLVIDNGPKYVRAWCRLAQGYRNFIIESILESQLDQGQSFIHQPSDEPNSLPHNWLQEVIGGERSGLAVVLAVPKCFSPGKRVRVTSILDRYASETAETSEYIFYRLTVVYQTWLFDVLIQMGCYVYIVSPREMRAVLVRHLQIGKSVTKPNLSEG